MKYKLENLTRLTLLVALLSAAGANAATIRVEKRGDDTMTCGSKSAPCATIQHAVSERSRANDRILVGPGLYEENIEIDQNSSGQDLPGLKLESTNGLHTTVIRNGVANTNTISIHQPRVRIGKRFKGFTIGGADSVGYSGIEVYTPATRSRIEGNRFILNDTGMTVRGEKAQLRHNVAEMNNAIGILCIDCDRGTIRQNVSRENGDNGFQMTTSQEFSFSSNAATSNIGVGILMFADNDGFKARDNVMEFNDSHGMLLAEVDGARVQGNIALLNHGNGISVSHSLHNRPPVIEKNVAIFNDDVGMSMGNILQGKLNRNIAINNTIGMFAIGASSYASIDGNNTYGSSDGCGISNATGGSLSYTRHYFGSAEGPDDVVDFDGHDALCGAVLPTGTHSTKPNPFRANKASRL